MQESKIGKPVTVPYAGIMDKDRETPEKPHTISDDEPQGLDELSEIMSFKEKINNSTRGYKTQ